MSDFALGWLPELEAPARDAWAAEGEPRIFDATVFALDTRPLPPAFSLAHLVLWWYDQGPVGSCFAVAAASAMQVHTSAAVAAGREIEEVQLSRAMLWYEGRKRDRMLGRPEDGGSVINVLRALDESGCCRESVHPYKPDHRWLERTPPDAAYAEGKANQLTGTADLDYGDADARKRMIFNGHPPVRGHWWPSGWDVGQIDGHGRTAGIGKGGFGHALCDIGWVDAGVWDDHLWWQVLNSHGAIYPVPSAAMRAAVPGYASARPDRCYSFWARDDMDLAVAARGQAQLVAPAGLTGFAIRELVPWSGMMDPIAAPRSRPKPVEPDEPHHGPFR